MPGECWMHMPGTEKNMDGNKKNPEAEIRRPARSKYYSVIPPTPTARGRRKICSMKREKMESEEEERER